MIDPSAASAAPFAPPPMSANRLTSPVVTATRYNAPSATLVTTSVSSPHQTGPSPNRIPSHTTSLCTQPPGSHAPCQYPAPTAVDQFGSTLNVPSFLVSSTTTVAGSRLPLDASILTAPVQPDHAGRVFKT